MEQTLQQEAAHLTAAAEAAAALAPSVAAEPQAPAEVPELELGFLDGPEPPGPGPEAPAEPIWRRLGAAADEREFISHYEGLRAENERLRAAAEAAPQAAMVARLAQDPARIQQLQEYLRLHDVDAMRRTDSGAYAVSDEAVIRFSFHEALEAEHAAHPGTPQERQEHIDKMVQETVAAMSSTVPGKAGLLQYRKQLNEYVAERKAEFLKEFGDAEAARAAGDSALAADLRVALSGALGAEAAGASGLRPEQAGALQRFVAAKVERGGLAGLVDLLFRGGDGRIDPVRILQATLLVSEQVPLATKRQYTSGLAAMQEKMRILAETGAKVRAVEQATNLDAPLAGPPPPPPAPARADGGFSDLFR